MRFFLDAKKDRGIRFKDNGSEAILKRPSTVLLDHEKAMDLRGPRGPHQSEVELFGRKSAHKSFVVGGQPREKRQRLNVLVDAHFGFLSRPLERKSASKPARR